MFYKVIAGGKAYYSKEIIKQFYHCGDGIELKVKSGLLEAFNILDRVVYAIPSAKDAEYIEKIYSPTVQDIEAVTKDFIKVGKGVNNLDRVAYNPNEPTFKYGNFTFTKFTSVVSKSKYRDQSHLPVLEVCGTKYVALGCIKRGETYYIG